MKKIFIACAHTQGAPLSQLVAEARSIEKALQPLKERGLIQVISNRAANVDDIFQTFTREQDIQIIHYSGHADEQSLYLEERGNIKGIAELFGLSRNVPTEANPLRLAFINGCSSKGQVAGLHQAGVAAVIATSRPVEDKSAKLLAEQFYQCWTGEGKTLAESFEVAKARVHTLEGQTTRFLGRESSPFKEAAFHDTLPWGLYFNPSLQNVDQIENWVLHQTPKLPPMLLAEVKPNPTQSLRALVHEFRTTDADAQQLIRQERKDPLMVLIERLPWIIGTHLRRLFAVEPARSMTDPGIARLKELIAAYTELVRFISFLSLSMLWDAVGDGCQLKPFPFNILPEESDYGETDYVYRTRCYYEQLAPMDNADPLKLQPEIELFLKKIDDDNELRPGYLLMEEWKQALANGEERFSALIQSRSQDKANGIKNLVLEAEALYARFLKASLFLTRYKLHTVRSIVVDKIRSLEAERPYSHYTISLHAAFSQLQTSLTERATATDNYCLLLAPRSQSGDMLANAINLSPFYLDRSSFIGSSTSNYPAVFTLDFYRDKGYDKEYVYHYIDIDINHNYAFAKDNQLIIDPYGAVLPEHLEAESSTMERFERIYEQLQKLEQDIAHRI